MLVIAIDIIKVPLINEPTMDIELDQIYIIAKLNHELITTNHNTIEGQKILFIRLTCGLLCSVPLMVQEIFQTS